MSSGQNSQADETQTTDAETVANYLKQHPEFFDQHPDVLAELDLSHQCGGAVSLIERQISTLRDQSQKAKQQLKGLIQIARDNDQLNERMHRLTLAMMDATNLNEVYIALDDSLRGDFQADAINIKLFIDPDSIEIDPASELMQTIFVPINDSKLTDFKHILTQEKPTCGKLKDEQLSYMFGSAAGNVKSTAVVPLGGDSCNTINCDYIGILVIGSHDAQRFHANMGTLFLTNLGEITSRAINSHIVAKERNE